MVQIVIMGDYSIVFPNILRTYPIIVISIMGTIAQPLLVEVCTEDSVSTVTTEW